ncbi:MAG TPA: D-alanine--D-alanine ligase [Wenzhouxiangellaceae bacterium]|nr:D-alanine--D-alanine ligase [Wenzhouxiangellaceae bacterium]
MSRIDAARFGRLALVYGGESAEREISLRSGRAVAAALQRLGVAHTTFDGPRALVDAAREGQVDTVFNMLHGRGGEDGCLQGALTLYGVPFTGSGVLASALTMDKLQTKRVWRAVGLPTPEWHVAEKPDDADLIADAAEFPVFVKPAREGSSVGMSRVLEPAGLKPALQRALEHDRTALVERMIQGPEYTAAILDDQALPLIRIVTPREFYDFDAKYEAGDTEYHCPCGLNSELETELRSLALRAFGVLGCKGWGRIDFLLDGDGRPWLLEANTVPGMTDHSLVPMAAAAADLDFDQLVARVLETAGGAACGGY